MVVVVIVQMTTTIKDNVVSLYQDLSFKISICQAISFPRGYIWPAVENTRSTGALEAGVVNRSDASADKVGYFSSLSLQKSSGFSLVNYNCMHHY